MKGKIKEYGIITIGILLVAVAIQYFYVPNNITGGGVTGIALVVNHYIPYANLGILMAIMNVFLFIIAFIVIGRNLGIVFTQNASTGGTDIIAKILNKFFHIDMGKGMQMVDILVVIFSGLTFGIEKGIYACICVLLNGIVIDKVISGFNTCHQVIIFTEKIEELKKYIIEDIDRGCTIFRGEGGYTGEKKSAIYCVLGRSQLMQVRKFIKDNEPQAFVIVNDAHDVLGKGFGDIE